jgi:hypothetical protein
MASATLNFPNRKPPPLPKRARQSFHSAVMRAMSFSTSGVALAGRCLRQFMDMCWRKAKARVHLGGHGSRHGAGVSAARCFCGNLSARYSPMASDSHTVILPSISTGTLPEGEYFLISALEVSV